MPRWRQSTIVLAGAVLLVAAVAWVTGAPRAQGGDSAEEVFEDHISEPIVQSRCIKCHVPGGVSGHTRLVLAPSTEPNHQALNLETFKSLLDAVADDGGAGYVLNKIQGVAHGGGLQVPAGSSDFANMERFLGLLAGGGDTATASLTPDTLFDTVRMAPHRKTLRRAALIFAGRLPTDEEYAAVEGGGVSDLRTTVRGLMAGPEFHEFLIRGSNDRLLTDRRSGRLIDDGRFFVDHVNEHYHRKKAAQAIDDERAWYEFHHWLDVVDHGARRAPLELIAYVVENDRPYTEILTADYVMANPFAAKAYGASTYFRDSEDEHEFRPSRIVTYYREGEGYEAEDFPVLMASRVIDPGPLRTTYPHAGILNTLSFLQRYPTTATNRNRARARWTYYHFLGLDIEKSAARTTDPVALADTHNPTMRNPACTVCHSVMDPVAGAFQNYDEAGRYKSQWGGLDSLDDLYKYEDMGPTSTLRAGTWQDRETLRWQVALASGTETLRVMFTNPFHDEETDEQRFVYLDRMSVSDDEGEVIASYEFEDLGPPTHPDGWECGEVLENPSTGRRDHLFLHWGHHGCAIFVEIEPPADGVYEVQVVAWAAPDWYEQFGEDGFARLSVVVNAYEEGDVWYGDMRTPGFDGAAAPDSDNSLQWLAQRIVADDRFAAATVKFWWPAIMGTEVAGFPEDERDADFEGLLLAAGAQSSEVARLANGFRRGFPGSPYTYNLRDLLTEIVLSKWFRADAVTDGDPVRRTALRDAGARRLLTPEELARKTAAVTGYQWGRHIRTGCYPECDRTPNSLTDEYRLLYGGIDSDGVPERARDVTSVMAGVAKRHAVEVGCPVVLRDLFLLPDSKRWLFAGISPTERGAEAVKAKLVDLHDRLLGVRVTADSPDVEAAYRLFVDVAARGTRAGRDWFEAWRCSVGGDLFYFDGIIDDAVMQGEDDHGTWYDLDWDRVDDLMEDKDFSDPHNTAQAWVVVVTAMLMDYRYLYL